MIKKLLSLILILISLSSFSQEDRDATRLRTEIRSALLNHRYQFSGIDSIEWRKIGIDLQKSGDLKTTSLVFKLAGSALVAGGAYLLANPQYEDPEKSGEENVNKGIVVIGSALLVASIPLDFISASKTSRAGMRIQHLY